MDWIGLDSVLISECVEEGVRVRVRYGEVGVGWGWGWENRIMVGFLM